VPYAGWCRLVRKGESPLRTLRNYPKKSWLLPNRGIINPMLQCSNRALALVRDHARPGAHPP